jgi:hypothetical protein
METRLTGPVNHGASFKVKRFARKPVCGNARRVLRKAWRIAVA